MQDAGVREGMIGDPVKDNSEPIRDKWSSRARPCFLYCMSFLIMFSIPMGIISYFDPDAARDIAAGMDYWLKAIPEQFWHVFWVCFVGYTAGRTVEKVKGVAL